MPRDKITIGLFSRQIDGPDGPGTGYNRTLLAEKENIQSIKAALTKAAIDAGREPPEIVISVLLIPDWDQPANSYNDETYLKTQQAFIADVRDHFQEAGVAVQDFYNEAELTAAEKGYLHQLKSFGSNIDIIKTRAILDNTGCRHLQMDSNTQIANPREFYAQTFGSQTQIDALNACFYSQVPYISAHYKIIYTTSVAEGSSIAAALGPVYLEYCNAHKNDDNEIVYPPGTSKDSLDESGKRVTPIRIGGKSSLFNAIYQNVVTVAMSNIGLARQAVDESRAKPFVFYPAMMDRLEYRITRFIVAAVNMSWNGAQISQRLRELQSISRVKIEDNACDFANFAYLLKKHTIEPVYHMIGLEDPSDISAREQLMALSDLELDSRLIIGFFEHVAREYPDKLPEVVRMIPDTAEGNNLCQLVFNCSTTEFHVDPTAQIEREAGSRLEPSEAQLLELSRVVMAKFKAMLPKLEEDDVPKDADEHAVASERGCSM